jgi:hypothetical protein
MRALLIWGTPSQVRASLNMRQEQVFRRRQYDEDARDACSDWRSVFPPLRGPTWSAARGGGPRFVRVGPNRERVPKGRYGTCAR